MAGPLDDPPRNARVRCTFYTKTPGPDGSGFVYRMVSPHSADGDGDLSTFHPPLIGDLLVLADRYRTSTTGMWRVTGRQWLHSAYGSEDWPYGKQHPILGPMLTIIVEPADGLFVDQVPDPEASEDDTPEETQQDVLVQAAFSQLDERDVFPEVEYDVEAGLRRFHTWLDNPTS